MSTNFDYEKLCQLWKWKIPRYYNIGRDCTDKHAKRKSHRNKIALYWEDEEGKTKTYTFYELARITNQIGNALLSLGFSRGDRLLIRLPNLPEFPFAFLGAVKIGAVPIPSSTMLTAEEVDFLLTDSGARGVVTTPDFYEAVEVNRGKQEELKHVLIVGEKPPSDCEDFCKLLEKSPSRLNVTETKADDMAYICYTSGTTGFPKGVVHAQRALIGHDPSAAYWQALGPDDIVFHAGKLNWTYTLGTGCLDPWRLGCSSLIYGGEHNPKKFFELIARYRVNVFMAVPTVYRQMLRVANEVEVDLTSLRHGLSAGEHLYEDLFLAWRDRLGIELYDGLGMSEFSYYLSNMPGMPIKPGAKGKPQPGHHRLTLLDEEGREVPPEEVGVLAAPGDDPGIMLRYWMYPEETEKMFRGGWFISGDFFYKDEDGYFWLVGREDDLITTFGYRVSPFEVERVLGEHPAVGECAVTGIGITEDKTITTAFVVLKDGGIESEELKGQLLDYSLKRLAKYKCPREVVFLKFLPKTPNGKIKRKQLREEFNL